MIVRLKKENIIKAWNNGCPIVKKVLEDLHGKEMFEDNNSILYINGDESTDGSRRFVIEKRVNGIWQPASLDF